MEKIILIQKQRGLLYENSKSYSRVLQRTDTVCDSRHQLYKKDFNAGETVTLGEVNQSGCVNYAVAATAQQTVPVIGDINADGICNKTDLVMLRDYLLTAGTLTPEQGKNADMNADGKLNAIDLTLLKRILIKA